MDKLIVEPLGEWEPIRNAYGELEGYLHKGCGCETKSATKFCPHCGRKMKIKN